MSISRRLFLRHTAAAGVSSAIAPAVAEPSAAEPQKTPHEKAIWYMRELERLAIEDGASAAMVMLVGRPASCGDRGTYEGFKTIMIDHHGAFHDDDGMFAVKGGGRNG